jgi:hypothetical protein
VPERELRSVNSRSPRSTILHSTIAELAKQGPETGNLWDGEHHSLRGCYNRAAMEEISKKAGFMEEIFGVDPSGG